MVKYNLKARFAKNGFHILNMRILVFHAALRQISNKYFCATSSRELAVCAIFYAFTNYDSKPPVMFQTIDAVIKRSNFRLKKLGEILQNISIQIDILNWNQVNQQNTMDNLMCLPPSQTFFYHTSLFQAAGDTPIWK